jgi:hypothetical protein
MNVYIEKIKQHIEPLRQEIIHHPVYSAIRDLDDLKIFMQYHVYAVWDFMSLLKTLQNKLSCTSVPWFPEGSADSRFFINEIVVGEESDLDHAGKRTSHFELYLDAMRQCGADVFQINKFISVLKKSGHFPSAFSAADSPKQAQDFVNFTFDIIGSNKAHLQAAVFTFGREDLIPGMFFSIVNDMHRNFPDSVSVFKYYLERHIEIDGDHHSRLALQMIADLCGGNEEYWEEALEASKQSLQKRIALWDGVYKEILIRQSASR